MRSEAGGVDEDPALQRAGRNRLLQFGVRVDQLEVRLLQDLHVLVAQRLGVEEPFLHFTVGHQGQRDHPAVIGEVHDVRGSLDDDLTRLLRCRKQGEGLQVLIGGVGNSLVHAWCVPDMHQESRESSRSTLVRAGDRVRLHRLEAADGSFEVPVPDGLQEGVEGGGGALEETRRHGRLGRFLLRSLLVLLGRLDEARDRLAPAGPGKPEQDKAPEEKSGRQN